MKRELLRAKLAEQRAKYANWSYADFASLTEPITEQFGELSSDMSVSEDFYQVGLRVLERTPEYILVGITVDDGGRGGIIWSEAATLRVDRGDRGGA